VNASQKMISARTGWKAATTGAAQGGEDRLDELHHQQGRVPPKQARSNAGDGRDDQQQDRHQVEEPAEADVRLEIVRGAEQGDPNEEDLHDDPHHIGPDQGEVEVTGARDHRVPPSQKETIGVPGNVGR
jgi:hypothetical protein